MTHIPEAQGPRGRAGASGGPVPTEGPPGVAAAFFGGGIYRQFYVLFFVNVAFFLGAILPWHGGTDARLGLLTYPGAILLFLSFASLLSSIGGIYTRRVVIVPTLATWLVADALVTVKILNFLRVDEGTLSRVFSAQFKEGLRDLGGTFGIGFTFIGAAAVFFLLFMVVSVFSGARTQAKKKEAQKQARSAGRKSGAGARGGSAPGPSPGAARTPGS